MLALLETIPAPSFYSPHPNPLQQERELYLLWLEHFWIAAFAGMTVCAKCGDLFPTAN
jgi:hypothetical protein